jgi:bZIP transcription factor
MTAAVVPLPVPLPLQLAELTAEARKRRREILASQRVAEATLKAIEPMIPMPVMSQAPTKRRKVSEADTNHKKPQMKYDPEVPMTKEDAALWRREQRRKRNRESAAASRQRQRDRIDELEIELEGWKDKFDSIMDKIKQLEELSGKSVDDYMSPEQSQLFFQVMTTSTFISPPSSPGHSGFSSYETQLSPVASYSYANAVSVTPTEGLTKQVLEVEPEHSDKMISRQAAS